MVLDCTWSVEGGTGCYSVAMDQYRVVLGHWVSKGWYWLVFGYTGSEQGGTGCQCDMLSESKWFTRSKPSYHSIFEEGKSDDAQTYLFVDLIPSVEGDG